MFLFVCFKLVSITPYIISWNNYLEFLPEWVVWKNHTMLFHSYITHIASHYISPLFFILFILLAGVAQISKHREKCLSTIKTIIRKSRLITTMSCEDIMFTDITSMLFGLLHVANPSCILFGFFGLLLSFIQKETTVNLLLFWKSISNTTWKRT